MSPSASSRARTGHAAEQATPAPPELAEVPSGTARPASLPLAPADAQPFFTGPVAGILMGNAVTLAGAMFQHWPALPVMLVYWGQSAAIGVANVIRIRRLKSFSTDHFSMNGHPVPARPEARRSVARFFAFHYGGFLAAFALILLRGRLGHLDGRTAITVAVNVALFAGSHIWHACTPGGQAGPKPPNLGTLMIYPYLRIIPMQLAMILATRYPVGALPYFVLAKTAVDLGMHEVERRIFQAPAD